MTVTAETRHNAGPVHTFSGDPTAMLPSPLMDSMRTVALVSEMRSIMLFISTSIIMSSVTTWWFSSYEGGEQEKPRSGRELGLFIDCA